MGCEAGWCKTSTLWGIFIVTPSLEGWPTKAKEAPSPHEVRLASLDTNPFSAFFATSTNYASNFFIVSSNAEHCPVIVCNSLVTLTCSSFFFSLEGFFCSTRWISYLYLEYLIDFNNSSFIWMMYGSIALTWRSFF